MNLKLDTTRSNRTQPPAGVLFSLFVGACMWGAMILVWYLMR
jgi:hypothetical protein